MLGSLEAGELRVEFFRRDDRIAHRILVRGVAIAESIEGTPHEDWPASPPFQDVHFERRQAPNLPLPGDVALLVGMAGRSHWSAGVQPRVDGGVSWDVACRVQGPPGWLGAQYRFQVPTTFERPAPDDVELSAPDAVQQRCRVLLAEPRWWLTIASDGVIHYQADQVAIRFPPGDGPFPRTAQLTYRFVVE